jgi:hypothetical protein
LRDKAQFVTALSKAEAENTLFINPPIATERETRCAPHIYLGDNIVGTITRARTINLAVVLRLRVQTSKMAAGNSTQNPPMQLNELSSRVLFRLGTVQSFFCPAE